MKTTIVGLFAVIVGLCSIIYVQAENNNQLVYDLNVSQAALAIAKSPYFIQHSPHCSDSWILR